MIGTCSGPFAKLSWKKSHHTCGGTPLQVSHISYKVEGNHRSHWHLQGSCIIHVETSLQGSHIPYKVWGTISHWQVQGSHIPYEVWGTIIVIDSHKVPAMDSNHENTWHWQLQGYCSGVSLPLRSGGFILLADSILTLSLTF